MPVEPSHPARFESPWDAIQDYDVRRFGSEILDHDEQERWSRAVLLAGALPFMWRNAQVIRNFVYDRLELNSGDEVLVIGEGVSACGFDSDIRRRVGAGTVHVVDIIDEARDRYIARARGKHGQLATWRFSYPDEWPDNHFDAVAVLQAVQHAEDWAETGRDLIRLVKPGKQIVLAEIAFGPNFQMRAEADLHLSYLVRKLFDRVGWTVEEFPYYSLADLNAAFGDALTERGELEWRGLEAFWGRKPIC